MFTEVLKTVAKFLIILVIFIVAFGNTNFPLHIPDNIHHHVKDLDFISCSLTKSEKTVVLLNLRTLLF